MPRIQQEPDIGAGREAIGKKRIQVVVLNLLWLDLLVLTVSIESIGTVQACFRAQLDLASGHRMPSLSLVDFRVTAPRYDVPRYGDSRHRLHLA